MRILAWRNVACIAPVAKTRLPWAVISCSSVYHIFSNATFALTEKNSQYLLARPAMRYQVVEDYRKEYPVSMLCETLGVSLSGYYAWKKRPMSEHQREDDQLAEHIQAVYQSCRQVYGSPRIHAELRDQGITSSRKRVARLMREQGLSACRRHHRTITTKSEPGAPVAPNLLDQDFTASRADTSPYDA